MFHVGRSSLNMSSLVPTVDVGRRLTRYAPVRMFHKCALDAPVPLLRILPASLAVSDVLNRAGGAKSRFVNVPDVRNACLPIG